MNMSDLMMKFFTPQAMQGQPYATDDGTDDWVKMQQQMNGGNAPELRRSAANWNRTPDAKLPAYSPTNGTNQSGTAY